MFRLGPYRFRPAESARDQEAVHRLIYRSFVREVPQHPDPGGEVLVDRFHHKNRYLIALAGDRVVGMVAATDEPPFSVAGRLADPGLLTAAGVRPAEIRLLAVEPDCRHSPVLLGLAWAVYLDARGRGRTHLFISAVTGRLDLYHRMGFEPLGPAVACGGAAFVPMRASLDRVEQVMGRTMRRLAARTGRGTADPVCLLPGPVAIAPRVRAAFAEPPAYHRDDAFTGLFEGVRRRLTRLTNSAGVALLAGGGTTANEAVAATLAAPGPRTGSCW